MHRCAAIIWYTTVWAFALTCTAAAQEPAAPPPPASIDTSPLVVEAVINAPIADVWDVFATAEGFKKFGVVRCEMDLRIGGMIRTSYNPESTLNDEHTIYNEILAYEPPRMMAFRIHKPPQNFPFAEETWRRTWSVATLTDLGDGRTHLRLTGLGYTAAPESQRMRAFFQSGNAWVLQHLAQQFDADAPTPERAAHAEDPLAPITHERVIELPRHEVWTHLATAEGWRKFLNVEARIELHPEGPFEVYFQPDAPAGQRGAEDCRVLSFVPGELLSFTWNAPPKYAHARQQRTWVVVRLEALAPQRTRVRLDHLGFREMAAAHPGYREEWQSVRAYFHAAWDRVLAALKQQETAASSES